MNPLRMSLNGAIGVKAGLGLDELAIDFAEIVPTDAVMVAIRGDNGTAKSTVMDLGMSPHLNPPQIPGKTIDQFFDKGERVLEWEHDGETYRNTIRYHHTKSQKKTDAFLHVRKGDKWQPMALPDHTVSDGKTRTYSACLTHILGPQSVYYLSAFRAQNAPSLADYDDPKELMRDLLQLNDVKQYANMAHEIRKEMRRIYDGMRDQVEHMKELEVLRDEAEVSANNLDAVISVKENHKSEATMGHAKAKAAYDEAISENRDREKLVEARAKIQRQISELTSRHDADQATLKRDIDKILHDITHEKTTTDAARAHATGDMEDIELRIKKKQLIIDQSDQIEAACKRFEELCSMISTLEEKGDELRALDKERTELKNKKVMAHAELKNLLEQGISVKNTIDDCNRRAGYVDQVPCRGKGEYSECPALQDAMAASDQASDLGNRRQELLDGYKECKEKVASLDQNLSKYSELDSTIDKHSAAMTEANKELSEVQRISNLKPELQAAKDDIDLAEKQVKTIRERLEILIKAHDQRIEFLESEKGEKEIALTNEGVAFSNVLDSYNSELEKLPPIDQIDAMARAEKELAQAERELREATEKLEQAIATQQQRKAEHAYYKQKIEDGRALTAKAERIANEIRFWGLLVDGLKGVIDLSIEDAGPGIADYANRLLRDAYGPRFTLNIVTQRQQQNGVTVECFDISVIDADTGIESSIINKSGGESVWLDKALTDAVGLYHQDAAGVKFGTLFSDEAEDGLTAERKRQFYQMDHAALKMGGFNRRYFISHNPEAWSMADAVIDMAQYKRN